MTDPLADTEIETVRKFEPHAKTIMQKADDRAAIGRILSRYRGKIATLTGALALLMLLKDNARPVLEFILKLVSL